MAQTSAHSKQRYDDVRTKFISLANIFLAKTYSVVKSNDNPELKIRLEGIVAELEVFLTDLDEGFDTTWKERSEGLNVSLEEVDSLAERLQSEGHKFEAAMDESWSIADDLKAFLNELTTVRNAIRTHLDKAH